MLQVQPREHHAVRPRCGTKLRSNRAEEGEDGTAVAATASWSCSVQPEMIDLIALNQIPRAEPSARA